jgi:hypothetical protein
MRIDHHAADRILHPVGTVYRPVFSVLWTIGPVPVRGMIVRVVVMMSRVVTLAFSILPRIRDSPVILLGSVGHGPPLQIARYLACDHPEPSSNGKGQDSIQPACRPNRWRAAAEKAGAVLPRRNDQAETANSVIMPVSRCGI